MRSTPLDPPTLAVLARDLPLPYGKYKFDRTLASARADIGDRPDLADPADAVRLRVWLNQWLCRLAYPAPGQADRFAASLAGWWADFRDSLPSEEQRLAQLSDAELATVSCAYADLRARPAAINRTVAATAAAKLLYFVRPLAVTAWDKAISARTGGGQDRAAFLRHLTTCRSWAQNIEAEGQHLGLKSDGIGPYLGRPTSSVAKLIDEWLYATITGGFGARAG